MCKRCLCICGGNEQPQPTFHPPSYRKESLGEATTMPSTARTTTAATTAAVSLHHSSGPPVERRLKPRSGSSDGHFGTVGGGGHFGTVPRLDQSVVGPFSPPLHGGFSSGMVHPLGGGLFSKFRQVVFYSVYRYWVLSFAPLRWAARFLTPPLGAPPPLLGGGQLGCGRLSLFLYISASS